VRVKKYVVDALPDAVALIRQELGNDAVIINSKDIKVGGFLGLFRKKKVEVYAAVESSSVGKPLPQQRRSSPAIDVDVAVEQVLQMAGRGASAIQAAPAAPAPAAAPPAASPSNEREQFIINELRDLKQYMEKMSRQQRDYAMLSEELLALKSRLLEQEIDPKWADAIVEAIAQQQSESGDSLDKQQVWNLAAVKIKEMLSPYCCSGISEDARVIAFVGPTGVGKTTTIAKLAAEQTLKRGRKVGFITSDTYRIAAVDQLRTYANILNVPLEIVFSAMDLAKAYKLLSDKELIYFDTAGRNFRSELHVSEVNSLLQSKEPTETILVLSLTGKTKDMAAVAGQFSNYGVKKVLFTKLDETSVVGPIMNLVLEYELCPTYLTSGQTVPDDIEKFNADSYIHHLLGEPAHE